MIGHGIRQSLGRLLRHERTLDVALAAGLIAMSQLEAWLGEVAMARWLHSLLALVVAGSLLWRRRHPLLVLAVTVAGLFALDPADALFAAVVVAAYTTGAQLELPRAWIGLGLAVLPFWLAFAFFGDGEPSDFVAPAILYGGAWWLGRLAFEHGRRAQELAERAALLEREQSARAEVAVAEERARIARELHDVVSHSISVIAIQTQAVRRRLGPGSEREADDLRALEITARQAMAEMRRLFGVLRAAGEPAALAPQPGLDQLDNLIARARDTGLPVELRVAGEPVALPPGIDLAAYRIVQEALTNTLKHAGATRSTVTLRFLEDELELLVEDDGGGGDPARNGAGHGLVGMRERALLYGGSFDAGCREPGGFRIRATLPFRELA